VVLEKDDEGLAVGAAGFASEIPFDGVVGAAGVAGLANEMPGLFAAGGADGLAREIPFDGEAEKEREGEELKLDLASTAPTNANDKTIDKISLFIKLPNCRVFACLGYLIVRKMTSNQELSDLINLLPLNLK
jgi:hypothetical protein